MNSRHYIHVLFNLPVLEAVKVSFRAKGIPLKKYFQDVQKAK